MPWPWAGMSPSTVMIAPAVGSPSAVSTCSTHSCTALIGGVAGVLTHDARKRPFSDVTPDCRFGTGVASALRIESDGAGATVDGEASSGVADGGGSSTADEQPACRTTANAAAAIGFIGREPHRA